MTLELRPHHLLCILSYAGNGYSARFVENFSALVKRIERGEGIRIVSGPDDICAPLQDRPDAHCSNTSVRERDRIAARDLSERLGASLAPGVELHLCASQIQRLRSAFAQNRIRSACSGCEWHELCTTIADEDFVASHLHGETS